MLYIQTKNGFTIIEMLVTVSILAILVTTVVVSFGPAREQSRDAQRQTDLRTVEAALSLYKNKYGVYPEACNGPTTGASPEWSGQIDSVDHQCTSGSSQYIIGLAPEFLPELPTDPKLNGDDSGYVYAVNDERSVYKFMALNTVEAEEVEEGHQFFRCGEEFDTTLTSTDSSNGASYSDPEICERIPPGASGNHNPGGWTTLSSCDDPNEYQTSYAISAGFSTDDRGNASTPLRGQEYDTEMVRCG